MFVFLTQNSLKFSTQGTLPHLGCRDSRRREDLEANWLLLHLFIHQAKHIWAQTRRRSEQVWYIGILVYWYIGILVYWSGFLTCSDRHRDWAQTSLARWIKRYSNTRYCPRWSLLREYRRSKSGKVNFFLKKNGPSQKKWNFFLSTFWMN